MSLPSPKLCQEANEDPLNQVALAWLQEAKVSHDYLDGTHLLALAWWGLEEAGVVVPGLDRGVPADLSQPGGGPDVRLESAQLAGVAPEQPERWGRPGGTEAVATILVGLRREPRGGGAAGVGNDRGQTQIGESDLSAGRERRVASLSIAGASLGGVAVSGCRGYTSRQHGGLSHRQECRQQFAGEFE